MSFLCHGCGDAAERKEEPAVGGVTGRQPLADLTAEFGDRLLPRPVIRSTGRR